MPTNSEWTKFSSEDIAFMDQQIDQGMQLWEWEQGISKTAGRGYMQYRTEYKTWSDTDASRFGKNLEREINEIANADTYYPLWDITRRNFRNRDSGLEWIWSLAGYAMENKALSKNERLMCLDIQQRFNSYLGTSDGPFRAGDIRSLNMAYKKWIRKWQRELRVLFNIGSARDVTVGTNECFKAGGIIIHNSIGASTKIIAKLKKQLDKAARYINGGNVREMKKVLYGHAFLVNEVGGHNVLGFYNKDLDNVYVRVYQRGHEGNYQEKRGGYIQVLIHELGHRCFKRFVPQEQKNEWMAWYNTLKNQKVKKSEPEVGEELWFSHKSGKVFFEKAVARTRGGTLIDCVLENGKKVQFKIKDFYSEYRKGQQQKNFPTWYAFTNYEENYCETVSMYLMGLLDQKFVEDTKRVLGIAKDEPKPKVQEDQGQDEETQQQNEKFDLTDQVIEFIVSTLNGIKVLKKGDKWIKLLHIDELSEKLAKGEFILKRMKELLDSGTPPQVVTTMFNSMIEKAVNLGIEQGKYESGTNILFIDVTELYQDNDQDNSAVEQAVRDMFTKVQTALFDVAESGDPVERTLPQLVTVVGEALSRNGQNIDVSVVSDIIADMLNTIISLTASNSFGAIVRKKGNKYVFYNIPHSSMVEQVIDIGLLTDYMENNVLENLGKDEERIYTLDELVEFVDMALEWGSDQMVSDRSKKLSAINEYINSDRFKDRFVIRIKGAQYIITRKPKVDKDTPDTAPKEKGITFEPMNELQTNIMKEICALLKGGSGDLTANDVFKSMGDRVGDVSLRGFGRSMGKLVRLNYLCPNGKCQQGSIYKLSDTGKEWCRINAPTIPAKKPASDKPQPKENSVESALLKEMRSLYQLVEPKKDQDSTKVVVTVGRELKASKSDKLNSSQVKKLSDIITKLNIDLSSLPLLKAQLIVGESADDESVTPLVMELRKLYVDVRKKGVSKRSLNILVRIASKVKEEDLNEITGDDLSALQRLIARAEMNTADYPLIFKVVAQGGEDTDTDTDDGSSGEDFPSVTDVMKIVLRIIGQNIGKEESASSIREKVNEFPDTNVTTKGLGRTMGALVRYGYLVKEGVSPSGTTYKGTPLLSRWYSANTPKGDITDLGKDILRVLGNMPNVGGQTSKQVHTILSTAGAKASTIGVGRSMGKLATDGWLNKSESGAYTLSNKGQEWFYSDLAKS